MAVTQLVDLQNDVLPFLGLSAMPADGGKLLQTYIDGVTPVIEDVVGRVINVYVGPDNSPNVAGVTYAPSRYDSGLYSGGDTTLYLRETPVLSVTKMVEVIGLVPYTLTLQPVGAPVDNFGFTLDDPNSGRVTRRSAGSQEFEFYENTGNVSVWYVAGMASVPANVKHAALELIRLRYVPEQESFGEASSFVPKLAQDDSFDPPVKTPSGYTIPQSVMELLEASPRFPGFA